MPRQSVGDTGSAIKGKSKFAVSRGNAGVRLLKSVFFSLLTTIALLYPLPAFPQAADPDPCPLSAGGGFIESPKELRSSNGSLQVNLSLRNSVKANGQMQYCYVDDDGDRSPTLRVRPGDLLILNFKNELSLPSTRHSHKPAGHDCTSGMMTTDASNLHFHGLSIPPSCHADDSLHTLISPSPDAFVYRFRIPKNQPPGLYWYHPHPHGHSEEQVLGGASGALIVEGLAKANPLVAGLPERVFVIRDQKIESSAGAAQNRDANRPAKDLSINFIGVPYPEYPVAVITTSPLKRELWRVLNASADTYVNLAVLFNGEWGESGLVAVHGSLQSLGLVAVDGVPISYGNPATANILWKTEIPIPPGGRAEFIFQTPPEGTKAELFTAGAETNPPEDEDSAPPVSTGSGTLIPDTDDYTPARPLARIVSAGSAAEPPTLTETPPPANPHRIAALATVSPVRQRKLYFSEKVMDPKHPATSTVFYITEDGHVPKAFNPSVLAPDIVVHQGDVEDWTIENRSLESHVFHIHQLHFLLLERDGTAASDSYLADTADVPYWDGRSTEFPSVKLRMDFRDPNIVGSFPYHCHILQHSDGGMMGLIQVQTRRRTGEGKAPKATAGYEHQNADQGTKLKTEISSDKP
jgi:FtsP/CotA-like multicopper oxidase with cupredoxin domain